MANEDLSSNCLVVIPAHNEEETIYEVVTRALHHADVVVIDDGSCDRTPEILQGILKERQQKKDNYKLRIITHPHATHIPKGIQDGMQYAVVNGYEYVLTMDAGLSHDPDAIPAFIQYDTTVDVVIGSRKNTKKVPLYRKIISHTASLIVNYSLTQSYFDIHWPMIADCTSGYRRYSRAAFELIAEAQLQSKAFDFHMEALALCTRSGMRVAEIPIHYVFSNSSFNKIVLIQGIRFGIHLIATK
jgi:dolichol-phosphate mannosyltransferase